ncbi:MAG: hypothetical protein ACREYE_16235 [Gammaproteobacteria bacterium]
MSEASTNNEPAFDASMFVLSPEQWQAAGTVEAGLIGFKIEVARVASRSTKDGKRSWPVADLEVSILARSGPGKTDQPRKIEPPQKFTSNLTLDPASKGFKAFKSLVAAAGIKAKPGETLDTREAVKALTGRVVYGSISHNEYEKNGEKLTAENFGFRFGKSFEELKG